MAPEGNLLAAIDQWTFVSDEEIKGPGKNKGKSKFVFLNLSGMLFSSQTEFTPGVSSYADFEFHDLAGTKDALGNLRTAIEDIEPYIGYRLELRSARHLDASEKERDLLQEQLINLEYKLAYLDSMAQPRPVLLRFTQAQLPGLADVLRSYPQKTIRDGRIKYAFQATEDNPEGLHYLLIDPQQAVKTEADPLLLWLNPDGQTVRFRLDPFWARYYHGPGNNCLLFVPQGTVLSPSMHDWDQQQQSMDQQQQSMDAYLRDIMKKWYHGDHGVPLIPDRPIYIFEGDRGKIRISILDHDRFQSLQERLGWLNDNLEIIQALEKEDITREIAGDITGRRLAEYFKDRTAEAEAAFEAAAAETGERIAARLNEMTEILSQEISRLIREVQKTSAEILELRRQLEIYTGVHAEMKIELKNLEDRKKEIKNRSKQVYSEIVRLENKVVQPALRAAEKSRKQIEEEVSAEIEKLRVTRDNLRKKLFEL